MTTTAGDTVTGTLTGTGVGANSFQPIQNKPFNIWLYGTFTASVQLVRSIDGGTTWVAVALPDLSGAATFSSPITFSAFEPNPAALWNVNCTAFTSGTVNYQFDT